MEAATAPEGNRGGDDDPNKRNPKRPDKAHYNPKGIKLTKGRQKIPMKKIEDEEARLSAFSKRRSGIYKKAHELITLTGVDIGIVGITPAGRTFSFGHPTIEDIVYRFLTEQVQLQQQQTPMQQGRGKERMDVAETVLAAHRKVRVDFLNLQHDQLVEIVRVQRERFNALMQICRPFMTTDDASAEEWWDVKPDGDLTDEEVDRLSEDIQNFRIQNCENRLMRELWIPPPGAGEAGPSYPPPPSPPMQEFSMDNTINITPAGGVAESVPTYDPPPMMPPMEGFLTAGGVAETLPTFDPSPVMPPMQVFLMDNTIDIPPAGGVAETISTFDPPPVMLPPTQGQMGNVDIPDQNVSIAGTMHRDEEDEQDLAALYFGNDEGPSAGDF